MACFESNAKLSEPIVSTYLPFGSYPVAEKPQFPVTTVVIPCPTKGMAKSTRSSLKTDQSLCECASINPGAMT